MTAPEATPAVRRTAEAMEDAALRLVGRDLGTIHRDRIAREALSAALDVEEMARVMIAHTRVGAGGCSCGVVGGLRFGSSFAVHQAEALRATILGGDS